MKADMKLKTELPPQLSIPSQNACSGLFEKTYWLCPFLNVNNADESCNIFTVSISGHRCKSCLETYPEGSPINIPGTQKVEVII